MNTTVTDLPGVLRPDRLIYTACLAALIAGYLVMPDDFTETDQIGYMLRVTARVAFVLLMLAYVARPLSRLSSIGRGMLQHRRHFGLAMALAHTVHFAYVVALLRDQPQLAEPLVIIGGGLAFVLMWAMALTSSNRARRWMGRNWRRLHLTGMHYLWLIFMQSFAGRLGADDEYLIYALLTTIGFGGLGLRIYVYWSGRARTA